MDWHVTHVDCPSTNPKRLPDLTACWLFFLFFGLIWGFLALSGSVGVKVSQAVRVSGERHV